MKRLSAKQQAALKKHNTDRLKELLIRAGHPIEDVSKLERYQLPKAVTELQLKQPEGAARADPSGAEGERQLRERERAGSQRERIAALAQKV